jgi:hypothetical protein
MDQTAYDELLRRLVQVSERQDERMADMQSLLASLNTKYQRIDVTLIDLERAMTQQTATHDADGRAAHAPRSHLRAAWAFA